MADTSEATRDDVEQLAEAFMADYRAGRSPNLEQYAARYPHLASELRELLMALLLLEQNVPHRVDDDVTGIWNQHPQKIPEEIGEFAVLREIGRGGMGVVYEAVQQSLGRHVALKVLSTTSLLNPIHLDRFRLESRAAAKLHHAHIVPVFGVGELNGLHYYAMQFIQGQSLEMVVDAVRAMRYPDIKPDNKQPQTELSQSLANGMLTDAFTVGGWQLQEPVSTDSSSTNSSGGLSSDSGLNTSELTSSRGGRGYYHAVARIGLQVSEALAYAHGEGILHRDIKPANLLLDSRGKIWVTDFGLARDESSDGLTQTGDFVGTLRYMAPERLEGWSDRRSDIYSLGATLYEMLSARPFLHTAGRSQLLEKILHEEPTPLSKTDHLLPRDLETIILKAVSKEPAERYRTAEEMAEDLRRFLDDRSILARRSTPLENLGRICRRYPVVSALSTIAALLLVASVVVLSVSNSRIREESRQKERALVEKTEAVLEKDQALLEKDDALRLKAESLEKQRIATQDKTEALSQQEIATQEKAKALALAEENGQLAVRRFYAAQMNLAAHAWRNNEPARTVDLLETLRPGFDEPDLRGFEWYYLYNESHVGVVDNWRCQDGSIHDLVWSPDGTWFATEGDGVICLWDGTTGKLVAAVPTNERLFWDFDVSADGKTLVGGTGSGWIYVWDIPSRREVRRWLAHDTIEGVRSVAISPDGRLIATGGQVGTVGTAALKIWSIEGNRLQSFSGHAMCVGGLAFSPDGQWLASAAMDWNIGVERDIALWRLGDELREAARIPNVGAYQLRFSPNCKTLWARGKTLRKIDVEQWTLVSNEPIALEQFGAVSELPNIYSLPFNEGKVIYQLDAVTGNRSVIGSEPSMVLCVDASPSGRFVASATNDGWVTLRDLEAPSVVSREETLGSPVRINGIAHSVDDRKLWVLRNPLSILEADSLELSRQGPQGNFVAALPDKNLLAEPSVDGIRIWSTETNTIVTTLPAADSVRCASFSHDGKYLATGYGGLARRDYFDVWDLESATHYAQVATGQFAVFDIAFAPNSMHVAAGIKFQSVVVYDVANRQTIDHETVFPELVYVVALGYSSDGKFFAAGGDDGSLVLFDVDFSSGQFEYRAQLKGHSEAIRDLAFSPNGTTLASASNDGTVRLWDVALAQERCSFDLDVKHVSFSTDGNRLVIVGTDNQLAMLNASNSEVASDRRLWRGWTDPESPHRNCKYAHLAWRRGDVASAERLFRLAIKQMGNVTATTPQRLDTPTLIRFYRDLIELLAYADRHDEAEAEFAKAIKLAEEYKQAHSNNVAAHQLWLDLVTSVRHVQIHQFGNAEQWDEALACAHQSAKDYPSDMLSWYSLALVQLKLGDIEGYRKTCGQVEDQITKDESTPSGISTWTFALQPGAFDDYHPVLARLQSTIDLPATSDEEAALAALTYRVGHYKEAVDRLTMVLEIMAEKPSEKTTDLYSWLFMAMAKWQTGEVDEAHAIWRDLQPEIEKQAAGEVPWNRKVTLQLLNQEAARLLGLKSMVNNNGAFDPPQTLDAIGKRRKALMNAAILRGLTTAIEERPKDHGVWLGRAEWYRSIPNWELAVADYKRAIDLLEDNPSWNAPRKRAMLELVADREVSCQLQVHLADEPALWVAEGQYQALRNNWQAAVEAYGRAFEKVAPMDDCLFEYAGCLMLAGDRENYEAVCDKLRLQSTDLPDQEATFVIARVRELAPHKNFEEEKTDEGSLELLAQSNNYWHQNVVGLTYYRDGDFDRVIENCTQSNQTNWAAVGKATNDLVIAMAYHKKGQIDLAKEALARANERLDARNPQFGNNGASVIPPLWIEAMVLKAEATAMIGEQ